MRRPIPAGRFPGRARRLPTAAASSARGLPTCCCTCSALSAWWWVIGGVVLVVAGYRRVVRPDDETDHPLGLGVLGFALVLVASASRSKRSACGSCRRRCRWRRAAALGDAIGQGLSRAIGFNGATLLLLALFAVGSSLLFGISWLKVMERIGAGIEAIVGVGAPPARGGRRPQDRRRGHDGTRARRLRNCARTRTSARRWSSCRRPCPCRNPSAS